jgi:hypothetical protein
MKECLEMPFPMAAGVPQEVVRPEGRTRWLPEVVLGQRAERPDDVALNRTVVCNNRAGRPAVPPLVENAVLPIDRQPAQLGIASLLSQRAQRLALPLDDVRQRIPCEPSLARNPSARAEARDRPPKPTLAESFDRPIERAIFRRDPRDRLPLGMRDLQRRAVRGREASGSGKRVRSLWSCA